MESWIWRVMTPLLNTNFYLYSTFNVRNATQSALKQRNYFKKDIKMNMEWNENLQ